MNAGLLKDLKLLCEVDTEHFKEVGGVFVFRAYRDAEIISIALSSGAKSKRLELNLGLACWWMLKKLIEVCAWEPKQEPGMNQVMDFVFSRVKHVDETTIIAAYIRWREITNGK